MNPQRAHSSELCSGVSEQSGNNLLTDRRSPKPSASGSFDAGIAVPVVCAIIERNGTVFAARRKPGATNGNLWEFPGGKVHAGETNADALVREIIEELGITIVPLRELVPVQWVYPWITIELFPFVCSIAEGAAPQPLDHAEIGFFGHAALAHLEWAPADRVVVDDYLQGKRSLRLSK